MTEFDFRKSSYSGGNAGQECVEVAVNVAGVVAVRDSTRPEGARIFCAPRAWAGFVAHLGAWPDSSEDAVA
ncbi:hypothetical protein N566_26840 [Streptomycetaceae bacterium MP113-05]|nr:hypothetical protein N566_26840 [Streptomycetaceae bacterium MP113-05]